MKIFNNISAQQLAAYQLLSEKGVPNGYAPLGADNLVPLIHLPFTTPLIYRGTWDASTNTPTLVDGVGTVGDVYIVSVNGTQDLGSGSVNYQVQDLVIYNGTTWEKIGGGTMPWGTIVGNILDQTDLQNQFNTKITQNGDTFGAPLVIRTLDNQPLTLGTNSTNHFFLDTTGSLGLGSNSHPSALLSLLSTTKGFLPPVMTQGQRDLIASPAEGLLIYSTTTDSLNYYDGVQWRDMGAAFTVEDAQDAVGNILIDTATIDFSYDDALNQISAIVIDDSITNQKLAEMPANTVKVNATPVSANPQDLALTTDQVLGRLAGDIQGIDMIEEWLNTPPATSTSTGEKGQKAYDANFIYLCIDANTWIRTARDTSF